MTKNLLALVTALFLLTSCASLNPLEVLNPKKPSIEANLQVGKSNEQEKNNIKLQGNTTEYRQDAEAISNDKNYTAEVINNITQNITWWQLLIIIPLIGAALPSWKEYWMAIRVVTKDTFSGLLYPFKVLYKLYKEK